MKNELKQMSDELKQIPLELKDLSTIWERFKEYKRKAVQNADESILYDLLNVSITIHQKSYVAYHFDAVSFAAMELSESILYDSKSCMKELTNKIVDIGRNPCRDT